MSAGQAGGNQGQVEYASGPVFPADLYDPASGKWSTLASATNIRSYHSEAILLETGHVITTGSEMSNYPDYWPKINTACFDEYLTSPVAGCTDPFNYNIERFTPPYLQQGAGPVIQNAPMNATHGSLIQLDIAGSAAASVARVTFIRTSTVTHSTNTDQRMVELVISSHTAGSLFVTLPSNPAMAVIGNWFVFALDANGTPSVAKTINLQIGASTTVIIPSGASSGPGANSKNSGRVAGPSLALLFCLSVASSFVLWL